jgi:hypothetical protein
VGEGERQAEAISDADFFGTRGLFPHRGEARGLSMRGAASRRGDVRDLERPPAD